MSDDRRGAHPAIRRALNRADREGYLRALSDVLTLAKGRDALALVADVRALERLRTPASETLSPTAYQREKVDLP